MNNFTSYLNSKTLLLVFLVTLISSGLFAQQRRAISGTVKFGSDGRGLPGVSVKIKGTSNGAITDKDGHFSLNVPNNGVLEFSYVGFKTQQIPIPATGSITIIMTEDAASLNELVVIGYGTAKVRDLTGAVATISSKDFQQGAITNAEQLIANKLPGVQVTPISGKPGSGSAITIRGGASLNASNDPLYVIDGVPMEGWNGTSGPGILSSLNPGDIESFTVLKDASAAAIYGARASNGVILITTKRGTSGGPLQIAYSSKASLSKLREKAPVMSADEFRQIGIKAAADAGIPLENLKLGSANTDWQDEIYQQAMMYDNNISFNGGLKGVPYRLSVGHLAQDGILKTGSYNRTIALLNLNPVFLKNHLKVNLSLKGSVEKERTANETAIGSAISFDPTQPVYDAGSPYGGYFEYYSAASNPALLHGHYNPMGLLQQYDNNNKTLRSIGNVQIDYKAHFLPDLHFNINTGYDVGSARSKNFSPETTFQYSLQKGLSFDQKYASSKNSYFEGYLSYMKELKSISSNIDVVAGYSYNDFLSTYYNYATTNALGEKIAGTDPTYPFDKPQHTLISYYSRLNYRYKDRYILTATVRNDGSSRFSKDNRWGFFPSVALAWRMNQEQFLQSFNSLSDLKLRLGYGITGQQDGIDNYAYIPMYYQGSGQDMYFFDNRDFIQTSFPSATDFNRKWEQTATSNVGVDFGFFKNRLSGSLDLYFKKTTDLLNTVNIPLGTNFTSSITKNIGSMENKGIELVIKAQPVIGKDFSWNLGFNLAYNQNKITKLYIGDDSEVGLTSGGNQVNTVGYSRNVWYMYQQLYDSNGKPVEDVMVDRNGDGIVNSKDLYRSKSSVPKYLIGFNTSATYKKITAGLAMHANLGHYLAYMPLDNLSSVNSNVANGLVPLNLSKDYYRSEFHLNTNQFQYSSDYYLQNASFLKLDNVYVNYNFGKLFNALNRNASLQLNASVQNVFTITKYTGCDPEASANGGWENGYGIPRVYSLGISLQF